MKRTLITTLFIVATLFVACDKKSVGVDPENPPTDQTADLELAMSCTTNALYYGNEETDGAYNYYLGISDATQDVTEEGAHTVYLDIYSSEGSDSYTNAVIPDGTYVLGDSCAAGTLYNYYTFFSYYENGEMVIKEFTDGQLVVTTSASGKCLKGTFTLEDGTTLSCTYEGKVVFADPYADDDDDDDDYDVPSLSAPVNVEFTYAVGSYDGDEYDTGADGYTISLANAPINDSWGLTSAGYNLVLSMFTETGSSASLTPGTYTVAETYKAGTIEPGFSFFGYSFGSYCSKVNDNGEEVEVGLIAGGTVTVSVTGSGYKFDINLETAEGVSVKGSFSGDIDFAEHNSTLTGDRKLDLTNADTTEVSYFGDYFGNNLADWILDIYNSNGDGIEIEFITDATSKTEIPSAQYSPSSNYGVGFVLGEMSDWGIAGTWFLDYSTVDDDGYIYGYAAATGGWVTLSKSGDTTTVSFEFTDENGYKFSGTWSGTLPEATDLSEAYDYSALHRLSSASSMAKSSHKIRKVQSVAKPSKKELAVGRKVKSRKVAKVSK